MTRVYLSPPEVAGADRYQLDAAIASNWVAPAGPDLKAFESDLAARTGRLAAVALSSGTSALHLALRECGVGRGDRVLVSTFTFAASVFPIVYLGAEPVMIDSEASSWNLSPDLLAEELAASSRAGLLPRAAVVVDLYGQCADYDRIVPMLESAGVSLVEDAAEALGATYGARPAGSFGAAGVLSFNGNKIITTSGGGAVVTDDSALAERVRFLSAQAREPVPHYEHREVGYNYRLSNLLAAFGRGQLADLDRRVAARRAVNARYRAGLAAVPGIGFMPEAPYGCPNCWLTCILVDPEEAGFSRDDVMAHLERHDIESRPTWKPMHLQPVFSEAERRVDGTSEEIFRLGLCLPSGSSLSPADQDRVIGLISETPRLTRT